MHSVLAAVALVSGLVPAALAQTPLASMHFDWNNLPEHADTGNGERGVQYGYNLCNSTTEGPNSLCQTAVINSIEDFCLWGPPEKDSLIGNTEGESVAWCTKPGYGTRVIPKGAITGVQFMRTPDYVQVTGFIQQALIDIQAEDSGGELDPHGADQRGNPLGGLLFSNAFTGQFVQAVEWHNFMGGGTFCLKACDPAGANAAHYCEHVFDRIGCAYNAPAAYVDGKFESCRGDNQDFPGIYTDASGATVTYTQPPESLGPIQSMPYTARIPASSQCTSYDSKTLWTDAPTATVTPSASTATGTTTRTVSRAGAATTSRSASTTGTSTSGASRTVLSLGSLAAAALVAFVAL